MRGAGRCACVVVVVVVVLVADDVVCCVVKVLSREGIRMRGVVGVKWVVWWW